MVVVARGNALRQLCSDGRSLTWLDTDPSTRTNRVMSANLTDPKSRVIAAGLHEVALAVVDGVPFVASPEIGVCRARGDERETLVEFPQAGEI
jgi:hypothetical protein